MKLKSFLLAVLIAMTATATVTTYVYSQRSDHEILYGEIEALSSYEDAANRKRQVVGCGSYSMHDWEPGCCPDGTGCDLPDPCPTMQQKGC